MTPKVTVLMPVYNGEAYLNEAIESILSQTFEDFEFLIINDCSSDNSKEIIKAYKDKRINFVENETNIGLSSILNKGLDIAKGEYIARMDQDDISLPDRLQKQVEFMDKNPEIGICGSFIEKFGAETGIGKYPLINDLIKINLLFYSALAHPTVMFRNSLLRKYNLKYNPEYEYAEDYDLWSRCIKHFKIANLNEVLLKYRMHIKGMSLSNKKKQESLSDLVRTNQLKRLEIKPTSEDLQIHHSLICNDFKNTEEYVNKVENRLLKLIKGNNQNKIYDNKLFYEFLGKFWFETIKLQVESGFKCWLRYNKSELKNYIYDNKTTRKILIRSLIGELKKNFKKL